MKVPKISVIDPTTGKKVDWTKEWKPTELVVPEGWYKSFHSPYATTWSNDVMQKFVQIASNYKDIPWALVYGWFDEDTEEWKYYIKEKYKTKKEAFKSAEKLMRKLSKEFC